MNSAVANGERQYPKFFNEASLDHQERYHFALSFVKKDANILDAATGVGYGAFYLATNSNCKSITAIDISDEALKWANCYFNHNKIKYLKLDLTHDFATELGFETFDLITSFETIEHLEKDEILLKNFYKVLKNDGILIISAPNEELIPHLDNPFYQGGINPFHYRHYTLEELEKLLKKAGFFVKGYYTQFFDKVLKGYGGLVNILVCSKVEQKKEMIEKIDFEVIKWNRERYIKLRDSLKSKEFKINPNEIITKIRQKKLFNKFNKDLEKLELSLVKKNNKDFGKLKIVYVMTHVGITGGAKIIFEHANRLTELGHDVTIISHYPKPNWYIINAKYRQIPFGISFSEAIPDCDVIVATYWDHIDECVEAGIAPVVYFEQGDFHLYEFENLDEQLKGFLSKVYKLPNHVITVSDQTAKHIKKVYNRDSNVFHNAIDPKVFNHNGRKYINDKPYILMVGSEIRFKGINEIIKAYKILQEEGYNLDLIWITPTAPQNHYPEVSKIFISPDQNSIAELYRGALCYVSGSYYESFPLPPLEAMACGCPVISTANIGVLEYAKDDYNSLLVEIGDFRKIAEKIKLLSLNNKLREKLITNGLKTANLFNWGKIINELSKFYIEVANWQIAKNQISDWELNLGNLEFLKDEEKYTFEKILKTTTACVIKAPVIYPFVDGVELCKWQIVARRSSSEKDNSLEKKILIYFRSKNQEFQSNYQPAIRFFIEEKYEQALKYFNEYFQAVEGNEKAVILRYIVLCLLELRRDEDARKILEDSLLIYNDYTDLYYLYLHVLLFTGKIKEANEITLLLKLLGDAVGYPEFIPNIGDIVNKIS
ncbi:glycosyltransferase group 1 family protein [Carboxydothermus islandicus]|uniref:Glycosyltransferase group 1 family protein n=1 Tax=Carboxydothermus islandicus TaxID=661089 RepID=A0A1L8D4M2_9THEO|nr:glycosyltransferase [Carboxydothermus islandicus]GAV26146.1 glycosyltransferase group 1 family protein [Carboxydothermus islandicus]